MRIIKEINKLVKRFSNGIRILIKDISFDLKVPTFIAYGVCPADKYGLTHKGCGYGTHPTPAKNYGFLPFYNADMLLKRNKIKRVKDIEDISRKDIKEEIDIPVVRIFVPGFRNLLVSETNDPYWIMSEVCYEGGQKEASLKHLKQSALKYAFHLPEIRLNADPDKIFKGDYRETLLSYGGFKKNAVDILKQYEHLL